MIRRVVSSCVLAAVIAAWCGCGAYAAGPLSLATGQPGDFFWVMGKELCRIWSEEGLPAEVVETAGDRENIELVSAGKADIALVSGIALAGFLAEHPGSPIVTVASCWEKPVHVMLKKKLIETGTMRDLEKRKVYLGAEASPNGTAVRRILAVLAIEPYRHTRDIGETELLSVMTDFRKQELDGAIIIGPVGDPMVRDIIGGSGGIYGLVPADEAAVSALTGAGLPLFLSTIPADSYPFHPDPINVITEGTYLIAGADLPGETALALSSGIFDNAGRIAAYFPQGGTLSSENATEHPVAPLHPALK
jgi:TRAP transporter TAXI family solute receptor